MLGLSDVQVTYANSNFFLNRYSNESFYARELNLVNEIRSRRKVGTRSMRFYPRRMKGIGGGGCKSGAKVAWYG